MRKWGKTWLRRLWLRMRPRVTSWLARLRRVGRRFCVRYRALGRTGRLAAYMLLFVIVFAGAFGYFSSQRGVVSPFPGDLQRIGDAGAGDDGGADGGVAGLDGGEESELPPPTHLPDVPPARETSAGGEDDDHEVQPQDDAAAPQPSDQAATLDAGTLHWPSPGQVVRSYGFGRSPTFDDWRFHGGIDIQGTPGTDIVAPAAGRITSVENTRKWGWRVLIEGDGAVYVLAHLREPAVQAGQQVAAGDHIGALGQPGLYEAGQQPHLHFEVRVEGTAENPEPYLASRS